MRLKLHIVLLLGLLLTQSFNITTEDLRTTFHSNMFEEDKLTSFIASNNFPNSDITLGYKGLAQTMLADYAFLPTSKLSLFNDGKDKLEQAILNAPQIAELRYLRLLIQLNAPAMLGYNDNVDEDFSFFISNIRKENIPATWISKFKTNLLAAKHIKAVHKAMLNKFDPKS